MRVCQVGDMIGVRVTEDGYLMMYAGGDCLIRIQIPVTKYLSGVVDLGGRVKKISIVGKYCKFSISGNKYN